MFLLKREYDFSAVFLLVFDTSPDGCRNEHLDGWKPKLLQAVAAASRAEVEIEEQKRPTGCVSIEKMETVLL